MKRIVGIMKRRCPESDYDILFRLVMPLNRSYIKQNVSVINENLLVNT